MISPILLLQFNNHLLRIQEIADFFIKTFCVCRSGSPFQRSASYYQTKLFRYRKVKIAICGALLTDQGFATAMMAAAAASEATLSPSTCHNCS
jgi:hypothetical protein